MEEAAVCKRCQDVNELDGNPLFTCTECKNTIHYNCLRIQSSNPFQLLIGDVFFDLRCSECGPEDEITRPSKFSWFKIVTVTMYHLQKMSGLAEAKFFHSTRDIVQFINEKWEYFRGEKKKIDVMGTISGVLSNNSKCICNQGTICNKVCKPAFISGKEELNTPGFWKLGNISCPPKILSQGVKKRKGTVAKPAMKNDNSSAYYESGFSMGDDNYFGVDVYGNQNSSLFQPNEPALPPTNEFLSDLFSAEDINEMDTLNMNNATDFEDQSKNFSVDDFLKEFGDFNVNEYEHLPMARSEGDFDEDVFDMENPENDEEMNCDDSNDSHTWLPQNNHIASETISIKEESIYDDSNDAFNEENIPISLFNISVKRELPWKTKFPKSPSTKKGVSSKRMSEQEEMYLLHRIEKHKHLLDYAPKSVRRLYRKLVVRKLKRQCNLPLFDVDRFGQRNHTLDKFCSDRSEVKNFKILLQGHHASTYISGPNKERMKPYIWCDTVSSPFWLEHMGELLRRTHKNDPNWSPPRLAPLVYSYIRPQHIPAMSSLCNELFWPEDNLEEYLNYPEYTCVVLYKKLVVGFGVAQPNVSFNEGYISFIGVRPEWKNAHIGTFILYHLVQKFRRKDVTLHVAASNPAIHLYNKFGFKVEEFVKDFYDKYMSPNSKESRHAFKMRLSRS